MMCDKDCKVPTVYLAIFQLALRDKKKISVFYAYGEWLGKQRALSNAYRWRAENHQHRQKTKCFFIFLNSTANFGQNEP